MEQVLTQEALLWAQKEARRNWSVDGDRKTQLFHAQENGKRKISRIDALNNRIGASSNSRSLLWAQKARRKDRKSVV